MNTKINFDSNSSIKIWLYTLVFMVFTMVFIGGVTRLTDSGLSMVDWKPLMGAIPPLNEAEWNSTFDKYKQYPEYIKVNMGMSLDEFKSIFFWEYFHRLFGRLIGLAFFFPFVFFYLRKKLSKSLTKKLLIGFLLGGLQGLMGWYMVKSGLVNRPDVSQYRLAAHLLLAFLIMAYLYWLVLEINYPSRKFNFKSPGTKRVMVFSSIVTIQFVFGAFVAGLDAGLTHNTFPKMGRNWIPDGMFELLLTVPFSSMVTTQFLHRVFGFSLLFYGIYFLVSKLNKFNFMQKKSIRIMSIAVFMQFCLGVATLLMYVPVSIASMHQVMGCVLLILLTRVIYFTLTCKKIIDQTE